MCVCVCVCVCEQDHVGQEGPPAGWFLANPSGRGPEPTEPQPLQISESSLHHQDRLLQRGSQEHQGAGTSSAGSGPAGRLLLSGRVWFCYHIIWLDYQWVCRVTEAHQPEPPTAAAVQMNNAGGFCLSETSSNTADSSQHRHHMEAWAPSYFM